MCVYVCVEGGETEVIEAIYYLNTRNPIMEHLHSRTFYKNKMVVVVFVHAIGKSQLFTRCIAHGGLQRTRTQRDSACPERTKHNVQGSMYTGQTVLASHTYTHMHKSICTFTCVKYLPVH